MPILDQIREQCQGHDSGSPRNSDTQTSECSVPSRKDFHQTCESCHLQTLRKKWGHSQRFKIALKLLEIVQETLNAKFHDWLNMDTVWGSLIKIPG